jgi:hypothetical protein
MTAYEKELVQEVVREAFRRGWGYCYEFRATPEEYSWEEWLQEIKNHETPEIQTLLGLREEE